MPFSDDSSVSQFKTCQCQCRSIKQSSRRVPGNTRDLNLRNLASSTIATHKLATWKAGGLNSFVHPKSKKHLSRTPEQTRRWSSCFAPRIGSHLSPPSPGYTGAGQAPRPILQFPYSVSRSIGNIMKHLWGFGAVCSCHQACQHCSSTFLSLLRSRCRAAASNSS